MPGANTSSLSRQRRLYNTPEFLVHLGRKDLATTHDCCPRHTGELRRLRESIPGRNALQKYRAGRNEPVLVGGMNLLKPTLQLMTRLPARDSGGRGSAKAEELHQVD